MKEKFFLNIERTKYWKKNILKKKKIIWTKQIKINKEKIKSIERKIKNIKIKQNEKYERKYDKILKEKLK